MDLIALMSQTLQKILTGQTLLIPLQIFLIILPILIVLTK